MMMMMKMKKKSKKKEDDEEEEEEEEESGIQSEKLYQSSRVIFRCSREHLNKR